jgi:hypothetical protein
MDHPPQGTASDVVNPDCSPGSGAGRAGLQPLATGLADTHVPAVGEDGVAGLLPAHHAGRGPPVLPLSVRRYLRSACSARAPHQYLRFETASGFHVVGAVQIEWCTVHHVPPICVWLQYGFGYWDEVQPLPLDS